MGWTLNPDLNLLFFFLNSGRNDPGFSADIWTALKKEIVLDEVLTPALLLLNMP